MLGISIHAPHEGERPTLSLIPNTRRKAFQSTLPTRGSDVFDAYDNEFRLGFQSTLPTRGSDKDKGRQCRPKGEFQSTLPMRGSDGD